MKERMILFKRVKKAAVSVVLSFLLMSSLVVNSEATWQGTLAGVGIMATATVLTVLIISMPLTAMGAAAIPGGVGVGAVAKTFGAIAAFVGAGVVAIGGAVWSSFVSQSDGFNEGYDKGTMLSNTSLLKRQRQSRGSRDF